MVIRNNLIHDNYRGIWLDWQSQGTRVSSNILFNNEKEDLFNEVNHGPMVVDNNKHVIRNVHTLMHHKEQPMHII